ncbi:MAG TPA: hypothetical protein ENN19_00925 [Chloroflexi bacterium]|nr:hypothetical protein [Chloroflexota bacterium]
MNLLAGAILLLSLVTLIGVYLILRLRKKTQTAVRPISAFQDLKVQASYAAESGGGIHVALGNGSLYGEDAITSIAALQVLEALSDEAVAYNAPPIITVGDPTLLPIAQDILRRAYERKGQLEFYNAGQVRFVAPSPVGYAAGAGDVASGETVTATMMIGAFAQEVSLIADSSVRYNTPALAAVTTPTAISALYPAIEKLAQGEELYAAGAQLTGEDRYMAGLITQDVLRFILVLTILALSIATYWGIW